MIASAEVHETPEQSPSEVPALGMWIFLTSEVMFFGALLAGFAIYRSQFPDAFSDASRHLDLLLGAVNTAVLLTSSCTMAIGVAAGETGRRGVAAAAVAATALLGLAFLSIKGLEYQHELREGLVPLSGEGFDLGGFPESRGELFFNFYFTMTGLHALHLIIGIGALTALLWRLWRGKGGVPSYFATTGLYWHFVDIVWVFLFPLLYLMDR